MEPMVAGTPLRCHYGWCISAPYEAVRAEDAYRGERLHECSFPPTVTASSTEPAVVRNQYLARHLVERQ